MFPGAENYQDCVKQTLSNAHLWDTDNNTIEGMRLILSTPECEKQTYHIDYPDVKYNKYKVPYSCMLTLENSGPTKLYFMLKNGQGKEPEEHSM